MKSKNFMQRRSIILFLMFSLCASVVHAESPDPCIDGTLKHGFSVSAYKKVLFAPGNLQYNAVAGSHLCIDGSYQQGTWRFAEHQWDYIASDYRFYSPDYNGWIDLFAWGTSGWNSGANQYQPWANSREDSDYYVGGSENNSLTGNYKNADWAVYNTIGDDEPGTWRTLTFDEWKYLLEERANASDLCGKATVEGVQGLVFLPDDYYANANSLPPFVSGKKRYGYGANIYTASEWEMMEAVGAVFLPDAGIGFYGAGLTGYYWSTSKIPAQGIFDIGVLQISEETNLTLVTEGVRSQCISIRPVWDVPEDYVPTVKIDTTVCDTLLPYTWRGHEWQKEGTIRDTLQSVCGTDSICLQLSLNTKICCPDLAIIVRDTTVCDTLMPFTWRGVLFEEAGEKRWIEKDTRNCDSIEYSYTLETVHCERLYPIIVNKYNWLLLLDNTAFRNLFPTQTATSFQWYKNAQPIEGATEDDYSEQNELQGIFQLRVTLTGDQTIWSNILTINAPQMDAPLRKTIYDAHGNIIPEEKMKRGIYLIRYEKGDAIWTEKKLIP